MTVEHNTGPTPGTLSSSSSSSSSERSYHSGMERKSSPIS